MEPHETTDSSTGKWLPYADNKEKEYETSGKITHICQETQVDDAAD